MTNRKESVCDMRYGPQLSIQNSRKFDFRMRAFEACVVSGAACLGQRVGRPLSESNEVGCDWRKSAGVRASHAPKH